MNSIKPVRDAAMNMYKAYDINELAEDKVYQDFTVLKLAQIIIRNYKTQGIELIENNRLILPITRS